MRFEPIGLCFGGLQKISASIIGVRKALRPIKLVAGWWNLTWGKESWDQHSRFSGSVLLICVYYMIILLFSVCVATITA